MHTGRGLVYSVLIAHSFAKVVSQGHQQRSHKIVCKMPLHSVFMLISVLLYVHRDHNFTLCPRVVTIRTVRAGSPGTVTS